MDFRVEGINNLIQNMLNSSIDSTGQVEDDLNQTTQDIIRGQGDTVSISAMGRHINELYSELQVEGSEQALTGFRHLMTDLAAEPDSLDTLRFVDTATRLSESDTGVFSEAFETVNILEEEGISSRSWFSTLNNMDAEQVGTFVEITDQIISQADDDMKEGLLTQMMVVINEIVNSEDLSEEEMEALMDEFLSELSEMDTVSNMEQYITDFTEEML